MTQTLAELRAYESKLLKAIGDPTIETWFDDFKKRMRPVSELQAALAQVRAEIRAHPEYVSTAKVRPTVLKIRPRCAY